MARVAHAILTLLVAGCASSAASQVPPTASMTATNPGRTADASAQPRSDTLRMVVDTDVAPDDLVALAFLVASPSVDIDAITITGAGEVRCEAGIRIVLGLLTRLEAPDIPVACGRETPLAGDHAFPSAFRENAERAANLDLPASDREPADAGAVELLREATGSGGARLLTLGPLTNVAEAMEEDPDLAALLDSIWIMGGAVDVPGNVAGSPDAPPDNTAAEWNIYIDPTAADLVLRSGAPVRLVSLDGTNQVPLTAGFADRVWGLGDRAPGIAVLGELLHENEYMRSGDYYLWDPLAALLAAGYEVGTFRDAAITVETQEGPSSGATRAGAGESNAGYLVEVDAAAAEDVLLRVLAGEESLR